MKYWTFLLLFLPILAWSNDQYQPLVKEKSSLDYKIEQSENLILTIFNSGVKTSGAFLPINPKLNKKFIVIKDTCSHFTLKPNESCFIILKGKIKNLFLKIKLYDDENILTINYQNEKKSINLPKPTPNFTLPLIKKDKIGVGSVYKLEVVLPQEVMIDEVISNSELLDVHIVSQNKNKIVLGLTPLEEDFIDTSIFLKGLQVFEQPVSLVGLFRFPSKIELINAPILAPIDTEIPLSAKVKYSVGEPLEEIIPSHELYFSNSEISLLNVFKTSNSGIFNLQFKARGLESSFTEFKITQYWPIANNDKIILTDEILNCDQPMVFKNLIIKPKSVLTINSSSGYCIIGIENSLQLDGTINFQLNNFYPEIQFNEPNFEGQLVGTIVRHYYQTGMGGKGENYKVFFGGPSQGGHGGGGAGSYSNGETALTSRPGFGGIDSQKNRIGGDGGLRGQDGGVLFIQTKKFSGAGVINLSGTNGQKGKKILTWGGSGAGGNGGLLKIKSMEDQFLGKFLISGGISSASDCSNCTGENGIAGVYVREKLKHQIFYQEEPLNALENKESCNNFSLKSFLNNSLSAASKTSLDQIFRYFLVGLLFSITISLFFKKRKIQNNFADKKDYWREIKYSLISAFLINGLTVGFILNPLSSFQEIKVYHNIHDHGLFYYFLSYLLIIILHDIYFYFSHRLLHTTWFYKHIHYIHHQSKNPTVWATFSFHPLEALIHFLFIPLVTLVVPFHSDVLLFFLWFMILLNAHGHCGYEMFPKWFIKYSKTWFANSEHHNLHHEYNHGNYSIYFNLLDKWFKTNHPKYKERMKKYE